MTQTLKRKEFSSYTFGEGRTATGQLIEFSCAPNEQGKIKAFLEEHVRTIDIPVTGQVSVSHGAFGCRSRFKITQHKYAGGDSEYGGGGYIEVLEIKNPPDQRCGIVINDYTSGGKGYYFTEWETLEHALATYDKHWSTSGSKEELEKLPGFKRWVACGLLTPWFYAIGDESLVGDYAFPEGLQDDPVFRFGKQFVVFDDEEIPTVKTCMGTRFATRQRMRGSYERDEDYQSRLVYWNDGSFWDEEHARGMSPRPLEEGERWITEAIQQFKQLLAGKSTEFMINFTDGNKFVGKVVRANHKAPCAQGDYDLIVHVKGEEKPRKGWIKDFKPTPEAPDIIQHVTLKLEAQEKKVERVEIKECRNEKKGKKWSGVFFDRKASESVA